jgi:hypothetical protein
MTSPDSNFSSVLVSTLARYAPTLRKRVVENLLRDRSKLTPKQSLERVASAIENVPLIDRRLRQLAPEALTLLTLFHVGRRWRWRLPHVLELACIAGSSDSLDLILSLCEGGLLFVETKDDQQALERFENWVPKALWSDTDFVLVPPRVAERAAGISPSLGLVAKTEPEGNLHVFPEADGLELPLRLAVLWQKARFDPPRIKMDGGFFKKDHQRFEEDTLLNGPGPADLTNSPPGWKWYLLWGMATGLMKYDIDDVELRVAPFPDLLLDDLPSVVGKLWSCGCEVESRISDSYLNPAPLELLWPMSAGIGLLTALAQLEAEKWCSLDDLAAWLVCRHPRWKPKQAESDDEAASSIPSSLSDWLRAFLLSFAFPMRLIEAARDAAEMWFVRLTALGRGVLGLGPLPPLPQYPQTLLVQPNLEIIAYRQGLTPELIGQLSRFCVWKNLGAACTLQLTPDSVYRGLETGLTHDEILRLLQQHAVRELPAAVVQALKTWADKRERVTVYAAATLLEFASADDLQAALARGLPAVVLTDRLALVEREDDLDYRHFRLMATRDYGLPPDQCVSVADDGVTLSVDMARADLLLETELQRFAEPMPSASSPVFGPRSGGETNRRTYRLTPASLRKAREEGLTAPMIDDWFRRRTGDEAPAAVKLLLNGHAESPLRISRLLVLQTPSPLVADGLMQWPESRKLIQERLGPTALAVEQAHLPALLDLLRSVGITTEADNGG